MGITSHVLFRFLRIRIRDCERFILQPIFWDRSFLVDDFERCLLIPILWLRCLGIRNTGLINPAIWLAVLGVIDLLGRVESWGEVFEKVGLLDLLTVQLNDDGVIGVDDQGVKLRSLDNSGSWGS